MAAKRSTLIGKELMDDEDRFSKLPDDVLLSILKHLDLRDAVRSSTLSRRWRHIPSVLPAIVLNVESFNKPRSNDGFRSTVPETASSNKALALAARSILGRASPRPIDYLAVTLYLRSESVGILRAVDGAMSPPSGRGVAAAKLKMLGEKIDYMCNDKDMVRQGKRFLSCFSACPRAFAGLTGLHVESVVLGEADVPNVLRACPKLRRLSLLNCVAGRGRTMLALEHPELTKLKLVSCDAAELRWLPKLEQVKCWSWVPSLNDRYPLLFGHVPRLRRLMLCNAGYAHYATLLLSKLLANCAAIPELYLNFENDRIWIQPECPQRLTPLLQNLRILNLDRIYEECDLIWTLFLLHAAPLLRILQTEVLSHECIPIEDEMVRKTLICEKIDIKWGLPDFKHRSLAGLDIYGFQPNNKFMGYIRRVMKAAVNLEMIALKDQLCQYCGFAPTTTRYPRTKKDRDLIRKRINEGITGPAKDVRFYETSLQGYVEIVD